MTIYDRIAKIRENNGGTVYNIYRIDRTYGGSDFLEVFPVTKQYRFGNTRSTYSDPHGHGTQVTRLKDITQLKFNLQSDGYTDIDKEELR